MGDIDNEGRLANFIGCNTELDILSCHLVQIVYAVNLVFLCNIIALFGIIANVINIIIFYKQGFANAVNVSFFSLAISDMCCQVTLLWVFMCVNPFIVAAGVPWVPMDIPGGWPNVAFGRITSFITVFITAERCVSIITPQKVKQIITPKRATIVISLIYIINILILVPEYATFYIEFKYFPGRNATLVSISYTSNRDEASSFVYFMSFFTGVLSFVGVIVWTVILVVKLQQSSQWRKQASSDRDGITSSRDKKTVKMVAIIACVLIVCYTPGTMTSMASFIEPELKLGKRFMNICTAIWTVCFVFQAFNSSVNIFLYYRMSSKYRATFDELVKGKLKYKREFQRKVTAHG